MACGPVRRGSRIARPEVTLSKKTPRQLDAHVAELNDVRSRVFAAISACRRSRRRCPFAARDLAYCAYADNERDHLQGKRRDGSDGTRTRDLRRDRPLRGWRHERRSARQRSVETGLRGRGRTSGTTERCGSRRSLPVCCPQSSPRAAWAAAEGIACHAPARRSASMYWPKARARHRVADQSALDWRRLLPRSVGGSRGSGAG
jgi:hypothetical protein